MRLAQASYRRCMQRFYSTADWHGGMYAALKSYSLSSIPHAVIFFLVFLFTLFLQQNLPFSHFFTVLCHLFSLTLSLITINVRCWSVSGYL